MALKNDTKAIKAEIDALMAASYEQTTIANMPFFRSGSSVPFHVVDLQPFRNALTIEYADTWEDGDLFYPGDYETVEEMFKDMIKEIEN